MKLIVGLGNPGKEYEKTRHNIGFEIIEELAGRHRARFKRNWGARSRVASIEVAGQEILLVKPQTFMNRSGFAIKALLKQKKLNNKDLVVVFDDADLPPGRLRVRGKGSAGSHNGLKSIIALLETEVFGRLRMGIGARPEGSDMAAYVLSPFSAEERVVMDDAVKHGADVLLYIMEHGVESAMNRFNSGKTDLENKEKNK